MAWLNRLIVSRRYAGAAITAFVVSLIWFAALAWESDRSLFIKEIRSNLVFSFYHPIFFTVSIALFVCYLDEELINRAFRDGRWAVSVPILSILALLAAGGAYADAISSRSFPSQLRPVKSLRAHPAWDAGRSSADFEVDAYIKPVDVERHLIELYDDTQDGSRGVQTPDQARSRWDLFSKYYLREVVGPSGSSGMGRFNLVGLSSVLLTFIYLSFLGLVIFYSSLVALDTMHSTPPRSTFADPRLILMLGTLGIWFPVRMLTDWSYAYYIPAKYRMTSTAMISIFVLYFVFVVFVVIVHLRAKVPGIEVMGKIVGFTWAVLSILASARRCCTEESFGVLSLVRLRP